MLIDFDDEYGDEVFGMGDFVFPNLPVAQPIRDETIVSGDSDDTTIILGGSVDRP